MCGICGVIGIESRDAGEAVVRRMMAAMIHRGPDEEGILVAPPVAAGMRRLSIIDLAGGSQPVWNEAETIAVVFNGEIYNFAELRKELEALGHRFRTHSDTETIVHAYEAWGERCVGRLLGMFAFAIAEMPDGGAGRRRVCFLRATGSALSRSTTRGSMELYFSPPKCARCSRAAAFRRASRRRRCPRICCSAR